MTFQKLLRFCFILFGFFVFFVCMGIFFSLLYKVPNWAVGLTIGAVIGGIFFLIPLIYYMVTLIIFAKKHKTAEILIATIANWERAFIMRVFASISILHNNTECSTHSCFLCDDARSYVGKKVKCQLINETLYILEIIEDAINNNLDNTLEMKTDLQNENKTFVDNNIDLGEK